MSKITLYNALRGNIFTVDGDSHVYRITEVQKDRCIAESISSRDEYRTNIARGVRPRRIWVDLPDFVTSMKHLLDQLDQSTLG